VVTANGMLEKDFVDATYAPAVDSSAAPDGDDTIADLPVNNI